MDPQTAPADATCALPSNVVARGDRWRLESLGTGWALTIEPASFVDRVVLHLVPPLGTVASCVVLLVQSEGRLAFGLGASGLVGGLFGGLMATHRAPWWPNVLPLRRRATERFLIDGDGWFHGAASGDRAALGPSRRPGDDLTLRDAAGRPAWALHAWLRVHLGPRLAVTSHDAVVEFGHGLSDRDAASLRAELAALPAFATDRPPQEESPAPLTPSDRPLLWFSRDDRLRDARLARRMSMDAPVAFAVLFSASWLPTPGFRVIDVWTLLAAVTATVCGLAPALVRLLQGSGASSLSARVLDGAAPGSVVTVRLELRDSAPQFSWLDLRLVGSSSPASALRNHLSDPKRPRAWIGLWRLPAGRHPPGPDEHVDARFVLPDDARPSGRDGKLKTRWALLVSGGTARGAVEFDLPLDLRFDGAGTTA